jgi:hypothetical protein
MCQHLREREEQILPARLADRLRSGVFCDQVDLQPDVIDILSSIFAQIGQERVSIARLETLDQERFQGIGEDNPWAYRRTE